jgi:hypothetical protein
MDHSFDPILKENLQLAIKHHPLNIDLIESAILPENYKDEIFEDFPFDELFIYEGIFIYGLSQGKFVNTFMEWLDQNPKRRLLICESSPAVFKKFFSEISAKELIIKNRVHFIFSPTGLKNEEQKYILDTVKVLIQTFNLKSVKFIEHPQEKDLTGQREKNYAQAIENGLSSFYYYNQINEGYYHKAVINYLENLSINKERILIENIKGIFKGTPIILCGAGFSLPKIYSKLQSIQHHTLIAAAGTGAALLSKNHIESHFNAILDINPNPDFYPYYNTHSGVLFYLLRSGCEAVSCHQGIKILAHLHQAENWIQDLIKDEIKPEKIEPIKYWTVTDFLLKQLLFLGFGPIYLCGADHILTPEQYYGDNKAVDSHIRSNQHMYTYPLNIKGEKVVSKFDWVLGSRYIGEIASQYPESSIYYVTDEGLPINNVKLISTEEFNNLSFEKTQHAEEIYLSKLLQKKFSGIDDLFIVFHLNKYINSLEKCRKILREIEIELGKLYSGWQIVPIDALNPYTGVFFDLQKKLENEIAYKFLLVETWDIFKSQLHTENGFFKEHDKIKLTLFGLKIREIDFLNNQNRLFFNLFTLQKNQILERMKLQATSISSHDTESALETCPT